MMRPFARLASDRSGTSAVEMAMATPLLLVLLIGTFELGYYFLSEHVVQKAVRDAARYAARLPSSSYPACTPTAAAEAQIQKVARTGRPDGTVQRLQGWTADTMTTVTVTCDTSGTYTGVFTDNPLGAPTITVASNVPYASLFGTLGIGQPSLMLTARSQTAGFGA